MNVVDDALRPRGLASKPFDAEGLATRKMHFVADGILGSWVLDLYAARRLGLASTGHAARGTGSPPSASTTNLYLEPRSEEHTSELQSLMRISYAVFCLKKTKSHVDMNRNNDPIQH